MSNHNCTVQAEWIHNFIFNVFYIYLSVCAYTHVHVRTEEHCMHVEARGKPAEDNLSFYLVGPRKSCLLEYTAAH